MSERLTDAELDAIEDAARDLAPVVPVDVALFHIGMAIGFLHHGTPGGRWQPDMVVSHLETAIRALRGADPTP